MHTCTGTSHAQRHVHHVAPRIVCGGAPSTRGALCLEAVFIVRTTDALRTTDASYIYIHMSSHGGGALRIWQGLEAMGRAHVVIIR